MFKFTSKKDAWLFPLLILVCMYFAAQEATKKVRHSRRGWLSIPVIAGVAILLLLGITLYQQYHIDVPQPQRVEHSI